MDQKTVVKRMNALSPMVVANDEGLFQALGLATPQCGTATVAWKFSSLEAAKAHQCRRPGRAEEGGGEAVSVRGELAVELAPGHWERLLGTASIPAQTPPPWSPEAKLRAQTSASEPRLSFRSEPRGRLELMVNLESGRLEALAYQPGSGPQTTAFFKGKVLKLADFEKTFGVSLKSWLEHMTLTQQSCALVKGSGPPEIPPGSKASPPRDYETTEPVATHIQQLTGQLLELSDRPCDMSGARIKFQFADFPGLGKKALLGSVSVLEDRRRINWPTQPGPSGPGPAVYAHFGGSGAERIEVRMPEALGASAKCAKGKTGTFEADIAAIPHGSGLATSISATFSTECSPTIMRCKFEARSPSSR